ncbi:MAG: Hsp20/alpha crystallin family protein [Spirochaetota bacterium]|nr:Hsp20/alpha crystallin family protein [Spirochaetota bacterium]
MYTTYNLFDNLLGMRNFMNNFFTEIPSSSRVREYPYINLYEKNDIINITVIAPGLKVADLNLELINNSLIIEGEKKSDYQDKPYIRKERKFGKFKKSVKLPFKVDENDVKAEMKNGILTITLNKSEDAKPRKIEVKE